MNQNQFLQLWFQHSTGTGYAVSSGNQSAHYVMWLWSVFCLYLTIWCVLALNCRVRLEIEYTYHADMFHSSLCALCNDKLTLPYQPNTENKSPLDVGIFYRTITHSGLNIERSNPWCISNSTCSLTSFGLRSNETSNFYSTGCIMYPYL
jgi:hypothetical protein